MHAQACVASALNVDLDSVPNFIAQDDVYGSLRAFLKPKGLGFLKVETKEVTTAFFCLQTA